MQPIQMGIKGKHYTMNGKVVKPDDFFGIGGFKFANHIVGWIDNKGATAQAHLDNARRYIEDEVLGNGCRRMRAAVELMFWNPPYFNLPKTNPAPYTIANVANTEKLVNLHVGTGSAFQLPEKFKKVIRMYVLLAREYGIIIEVPWCWTIKKVLRSNSDSARRLRLSGDPRATPHRTIAQWNEHYIGNEANGIGAYLHLLKTKGDGEGKHEVTRGPLNLLHDAMNEGDVTNVPWSMSQLRNIARRWHTRDAPGEPLFMSLSGGLHKYYAPLRSEFGAEGFDAVAPHTARSDDPDWGKWDEQGTAARKRWPKELIDIDESQLGWTKEQRGDWVKLIPKWGGLVSTDIRRWTRMHANFVEEDCYTTFHTLRAMDAGWPNTAQTEIEETIRSITGGGNAPPPTRKLRYERIIQMAFQDILGRTLKPGDAGLASYNVEMENGLSEASLREGLIRSDEYARKNPEG